MDVLRLVELGFAIEMRRGVYQITKAGSDAVAKSKNIETLPQRRKKIILSLMLSEDRLFSSREVSDHLTECGLGLKKISNVIGLLKTLENKDEIDILKLRSNVIRYKAKR